MALNEMSMKSTTQEIKDWLLNEEPMVSNSYHQAEAIVNDDRIPGKIYFSDLPLVDTEKQKPGTKYDQGKLQYTLIPPYALQEVARNLTEGLKKYKERDNWQKVDGAEERYMDALMRHFEAIRRGETYDLDSSDPTISHMSAVAVNAMFLLEFMYNPKLNNKE
jgi:hypothetical protein